MRTEIAKVTSVDLFVEDHGILTMFVQLRWGSGGAGYGGFSMDRSAFCADLIHSTIDFFGVDRLEKAVGKYVIAEIEGSGMATVERIRRLPVDGDAVLDMRAIAKKYEEKAR